MTIKGSLRAFIGQSPDGVTSDIGFNRAIGMSTKKMVCDVESILENNSDNPFPINTKFTLRIGEKDYVVRFEDLKIDGKRSYIIESQVELLSGRGMIDLRMPGGTQKKAIERLSEYLDSIEHIIK